MWSDRRGRFAQGTIWLEVLCERLSSGDIASPAPMTLEVTHPATARFDAAGGFGHVVTRRAVDWVASQAPRYGVAMAMVRNSSHFGACGHHAAILAERGLVGIVATNAYPKVAPHGARRAILGTNPIAFAAPAGDGPPILGDLSTGAIAGSRVREAREAGRQLDPDTALDARGEPTRDVAAFEMGGAMLPFGGAKGSALGILVEILTSVLSGGVEPDQLGSMFAAGPAGTSHLVLALAGPDDLHARIARLRETILAAPPRDGMEVRLPGDHGHELSVRDQIDLPESTIDAIERARGRFTPESTSPFVRS